jgi:hypothetical protein
MTKETAIKLFEEKLVRSVWDAGHRDFKKPFDHLLNACLAKPWGESQRITYFYLSLSLLLKVL